MDDATAAVDAVDAVAAAEGVNVEGNVAVMGDKESDYFNKHLCELREQCKKKEEYLDMEFARVERTLEYVGVVENRGKRKVQQYLHSRTNPHVLQQKKQQEVVREKRKNFIGKSADSILFFYLQNVFVYLQPQGVIVVSRMFLGEALCKLLPKIIAVDKSVKKTTHEVYLHPFEMDGMLSGECVDWDATLIACGFTTGDDVKIHLRSRMSSPSSSE